MPPSALQVRESITAPPPITHDASGPSLTVNTLTDEHAGEVLEFLAARPVHNVVMAGFIRDNGLTSPLNRGTFYACRDARGRLEGVAIVGHATLVEPRTEEALAAFARVARGCPGAHVMMGEREKIERFWDYYAEGGSPPRLICRELLMEQRWPVAVHKPVPGLRLATHDELGQVMAVQAGMAFEESGVNPLEVDPAGFRLRCARRVERGRVWVWVRDGRLIFKADVISDTPDAVYLEGVWVSPEERGNGYGLRCVSQLSRTLLARARSVTLLVNEGLPQAVAFYRRAGYKLCSYYDTIYLHPDRRHSSLGASRRKRNR